MTQQREVFLDQPGLEGATIRLTRVFDAPRHLVQVVLSHPEHRRRWWGPEAAADTGATVTARVTDEGGRTRVTVTICYERPPALA